MNYRGEAFARKRRLHRRCRRERTSVSRHALSYAPRLRTTPAEQRRKSSTRLFVSTDLVLIAAADACGPRRTIAFLSALSVRRLNQWRRIVVEGLRFIEGVLDPRCAMRVDKGRKCRR